MEILDKPVSSIAEYKPFYAQLAELEHNNSLIAFDYESKKGNKEARSHVNTLRLTKGALERTRKTAKEESLRIGRAVDSEAKEIEARIEAMIAVHQTKLDEIDRRETDRVAALKERLEQLENDRCEESQTVLREAIAYKEAIVIDDTWQEFIADASKAKDAVIAKLRARLADREKYDAEQLELKRLREEAAARAQKDRDDAIAKAAEERARTEAAALAEREAAKARKAVEDAELKAKQEREAAERRELQLKLQAEQAERRRVEAEQKAEQDRKDALVKAEADRQRAIQAEKDRVAAAAKAEADAQAKREANKAHLAKINRTAMAALIAGGINEECAKECIRLIASGKVPAVQINY